MWELETEPWDFPRLERLCRQGWEPFGVVEQDDTKGPPGNRRVFVYLRRQKPMTAEEKRERGKLLQGLFKYLLPKEGAEIDILPKPESTQ